MSAPVELVFAENSPYDSLEAVIEQDDQVAYLYLRSTTDPNDLKSCWIRNYVAAPQQFDGTRLQQGLAPTLPARFCRHPEGQDRLDESRLRIVWFAEGDGVALLEDEQIIALIPPWSGRHYHDSTIEVSGYARDCLGESPVCHELKPDQFSGRIAAADQFWKSWETEQSPWQTDQPRLIAAYEAVWGPVQEFFMFKEDQWPPRGLAKFQFEGKVILATAGVSLCPQPQVELHFETPQLHRRFEFAAAFPTSASQTVLQNYISYLGGQLELPWQKQVFLMHGHTVTCDAFRQMDSLPDFSSILLWNQKKMSDQLALPALPEIMGDPVNLLWTLPLFENERQRMNQGDIESVGYAIVGESHPVIAPRKIQIS